MRNERRVLHLITRFLDGGAEKTTENTLFALATADEEYDLRLGFGVDYDAERVRKLATWAIEPVRFRHLKHYNPLSAMVAPAEVARYLRRERIKVLHTHSTEAGIIGRFAGAIAGTPIVIHEIHGDPIAADRNPVLNFGVKWLERASARVTTRFVVKSSRIRDTYLRRGIGERGQYECIRHGVDLTAFRSAEPIERETTADATLLFVGRLANGKGLFDLIAAFERLYGEHAIKLLIVGDGPLRGDLRREIKARDLEDEVSLLGYREDVPNVMATADVLVLPSYREGTPRVITEALAAGLPVVATNIAGIPEQVRDGETGYLVSPGDVDGLVDRLDTLLTTRAERERMGRSAPESVTQFATDTVQGQYRQLYRELL